LGIIEGRNNYHAVTVDGELSEVGGGALDDPTVKIVTDVETLGAIDSGELDPLAAYQDGRVTIEGVGFFEGIKFWFAEFMVDTFVPYEEVPPEGIPEEEPVEMLEEEPEDGMKIKPDVAAEGEDFPEEGIAEDILKVD